MVKRKKQKDWIPWIFMIIILIIGVVFMIAELSAIRNTPLVDEEGNTIQMSPHSNFIDFFHYVASGFGGGGGRNCASKGYVECVKPNNCCTWHVRQKCIIDPGCV